MPDPAPQPSSHAEPVDRLIDQLTRLPGVGRRSAERIAFHLLKSSPEDALQLARAIDDVKTKVRHCRVCSNLTEQDPCRICEDPRRDASTVLIVEQPKDVIAMEQTGSFQGVYHVLTGHLDPLHGVDVGDLTIQDLLARVDDPTRNARETPVKEVILGLNPDLEGDSTALYLSGELEQRGVQVTRLARGLPAGSQLEYVSKAVLMDALKGRQSVGLAGDPPPGG